MKSNNVFELHVHVKYSKAGIIGRRDRMSSRVLAIDLSCAKCPVYRFWRQMDNGNIEFELTCTCELFEYWNSRKVWSYEFASARNRFVMCEMPCTWILEANGQWEQ